MQVHLASVVPGFRTLNVKARARGEAIGTWSEAGLQGELTLADMSDGTLRLLCLCAVCLNPSIPPLLCIDEPELGLHPRVLPLVGALLRTASSTAQVIVATHSPYLVSQFRLDDIAVTRREDGLVRFVRPASSEALRSMVVEMGGEALAKLHISDELETLP